MFQPVSASSETNDVPAGPPKKWRRRLAWFTAALLVSLAVAGWVVKDYVRTLNSLRRVPGTNAFVMDYYVDYHPERLRAEGIDVAHLEDSFIAYLFPRFIGPIARGLKRSYVPQENTIRNLSAERCSAVTLRSEAGAVYFGRNLDNPHDACLILRVHDQEGLASIAVLDPAYINLDRPDLDQLSLIRLLPLLFAPYYLMDGMNRHGVVVAELSVPHAEPPGGPGNPAIFPSTLQRVILDYAHNTAEAVALVRSFNVHFAGPPEHLMVADAAGDSVIVEFVDGDVRVTPAEHTWQVCTNNTVWQQSEGSLREQCPRYARGSNGAAELAGAVDYAAASRVTRSMSQPDFTMSTSIYELGTREVQVLFKARPDHEYRDSLASP